MKISIRGFTMSLLLLWLSMSGVAQQNAPTAVKYGKANKLWLSRNGSILLAEILTVKADKQIQIWDATQRQPAADLPLAKGLDGSVLAISDDGGQVIVRRAVHITHTIDDPLNLDLMGCECWSLGVGGTKAKMTWSMRSRNTGIAAAVFQGTNLVLLRNMRVETRDAQGKLLRTVAFQTRKGFEYYRPLALSPDGLLAAFSNDLQALIFDTRSGRPIRTLLPEPLESADMNNGIETIKFSFDGRIATGTAEKRIDGGLVENGDRTITHRWIWDVKSGKSLWHWQNDELFGPSLWLDDPPFSPDGHAILNRFVPVNDKGPEPRLQTDIPILEFQNIITHKRAAFQIPRPWGSKDTRYTHEVCIPGDGKVVAALDFLGNIWIQSRK